MGRFEIPLFRGKATDSSKKPRVTERWRDALVISVVVNPVSETIADEVLFTMPPWNRFQS
jgi:hypothetical protein